MIKGGKEILEDLKWAAEDLQTQLDELKAKIASFEKLVGEESFPAEAAQAGRAAVPDYSEPIDLDIPEEGVRPEAIAFGVSAGINVAADAQAAEPEETDAQAETAESRDTQAAESRETYDAGAEVADDGNAEPFDAEALNPELDVTETGIEAKEQGQQEMPATEPEETEPEVVDLPIEDEPTVQEPADMPSVESDTEAADLPETDGEATQKTAENIDLPAESETVPEPAASAEKDVPPTANEAAAETEPAKAENRPQYPWHRDLPGQPVNNILSGISLNDRVLFINTLFAEDPILFQATVNRLNAMGSLSEAEEFLLGEFKTWETGSEIVYRFMMAVRRKLR